MKTECHHFGLLRRAFAIFWFSVTYIFKTRLFQKGPSLSPRASVPWILLNSSPFVEVPGWEAQLQNLYLKLHKLYCPGEDENRSYVNAASWDWPLEDMLLNIPTIFLTFFKKLNKASEDLTNTDSGSSDCCTDSIPWALNFLMLILENEIGDARAVFSRGQEKSTIQLFCTKHCFLREIIFLLWTTLPNCIAKSISELIYFGIATNIPLQSLLSQHPSTTTSFDSQTTIYWALWQEELTYPAENMCANVTMRSKASSIFDPSPFEDFQERAAFIVFHVSYVCLWALESRL